MFFNILIFSILHLRHIHCNNIGTSTQEMINYKLKKLKKKLITIKKHKIMKKVTLTIAAAFLFTGITMATPVAGNDNNTTSHSVSIEIPTVALIDIEGASGEAGTINLTPVVEGLEAGAAVDFSTATDNSLWLNYTSIVSSNKTRNINVKLDDEKNLPDGVSLAVTAGSIASGKGAKGNASGKVILSKTAQNLVTGIGSCYTESGHGKGHQLTYALEMDNDKYAALMADSYTVEITYTITEN
jgi:hypothetical protein